MRARFSTASTPGLPRSTPSGTGAKAQAEAAKAQAAAARRPRQNLPWCVCVSTGFVQCGSAVDAIEAGRSARGADVLRTRFLRLALLCVSHV